MVRSCVFLNAISTYAFLSWQGAGKARKSGRNDEKTHWNLVVKDRDKAFESKERKERMMVWLLDDGKIIAVVIEALYPIVSISKAS